LIEAPVALSALSNAGLILKATGNATANMTIAAAANPRPHVDGNASNQRFGG